MFEKPCALPSMFPSFEQVLHWGFSRFWEIRIMIFGHFGGPGAHFGGPGAHGRFGHEKGYPRPRKSSPFLDKNVGTNPLFAVLCFWWFFACSFFLIFVILGALRLYVGSHFDSLLGARGLWKNSWKCVTVINFRGLAPSRRSLFAGLDCGCVLMMSFCRFLWFWAVLRFPFWDLLVLIVVRKGVLNIKAKSLQKNGWSWTWSGAVGPLKQDNMGQPDNASNTPWRA
jgi:hypothetical protein